MPEEKFKQSIFKLGKRIKGYDLTNYEEDKIIEIFNNLKGDPFERAIESLEKVLGKNNVKLLLEKSASLDDINRLIQDVSNSANAWLRDKK